MKSIKKMFLTSIVAVTFSAGISTAWAETVGEKAAEAKADIKEAGQDAAKATRKGVRKAKDEVCEMINGKMECIAKKAKHKIQNGVDEVKDAVK